MWDLEDGWYFVAGHWIGWVCSVAAFLGSWWYCAATYGYLFGFGLGWLPSFILSAIVGLLVKFLWGPILLLVAALVMMAH